MDIIGSAYEKLHASYFCIVRVLFIIQEESFDFGSINVCRSPAAVSLWLETEVLRSRKPCTIVQLSSACKLIT
jgi:hypothetical protein